MNKAATAGKLVGMLRRQSKFLSQEARFRVYVATIRPILEYGCPIFGTSPSSYLNTLDRIQERAVRLFPDLGHRLDPLPLRRDVSGLCHLFSIINHSAPLLVRQSLMPTFLRVNRATRTSETLNLRAIQIPRSRTASHQGSLLVRYGGLWNQLDNSVVFSENMAKFKNSTVKWLRAMQR